MMFNMDSNCNRVDYWLISTDRLPSMAQQHYGLLKSLSICPSPPSRFYVVIPFLDELAAFRASGKTIKFYQENQERQRLNQALNEKRAHKVKGKENESQPIITSKKTQWENMKYDVPVADGQK
ncbi:hypothetical protein NEOLI_005225 [Neolecta irregularis DAH-3]|uniref:Uncharacterized protein n=1 Tax=Neolecta irregularis (strain DAH-3) TaxID=1198029 RepID=A0A1U7LLW0_NEOID|nr:hypothetical protein NEOLI_005225 [Neolecta irregularis DAH-3]|eukprot:OLL23501.1 hypothetical protein NEOLI_005225 [Neolecta irregularis DAH-3]